MTSQSVFDLSSSEKLQLIEDLWNDLSRAPENVPVYDWQLEEIERSKADLINNPESGLSWDEVKKRIHDRHGK